MAARASGPPPSHDRQHTCTKCRDGTAASGRFAETSRGMRVKARMMANRSASPISRLFTIMLDHLICDCDGVLVDSEVIADRVLLDTLTATFPHIDFEAAAKSAFGQQTSRFLAGLESRFGVEMPADFIETIEHNIEIALAQSLAPITGVRDALLKVSLPAAVVSNSRLVRVRNSLKRASLTEIFGERVFSSEQVSRPKPYPDVYLHAAQTLGVAPARCIVVEDSVSGLNAARAAGMKTIAFVGASHIPDNYADALRAMGITRIMRKMDELPALVEAGMRGEFGDVQS
ncbi:HAD-superfamily hydrolase subfamily IA, variant 3 [Burkholderia sp. IT-111MI5]